MKLYITGEITDEPWEGCFSPSDLKKALEGVDENEPLEVEITSGGGSVFAGLQCANILARWKGNVTTHAVGFCASIATVILMAGDKIVVDDNCFCLCHLPWSFVQGNKNDMEKEIEALEKCKVAMMTYYMKHAKVSEKEIDKLLEDEVWLLGNEFAEIFDIEVLACDEQMNIAAKFDLSKYKNVPKRILDMKENDNEKEVTVPSNEKNLETVETKVSTSKEEEEHIPLDEIDPETTEDIEALREPLFKAYSVIGELEDENEEKTNENQSIFNKLQAARKENEELKAKLVDKVVDDEKWVTKASADERVRGMQSTLQKQIDEFRNQLKAKEEELAKVSATVTHLESSLQDTSKELSKVTSALEEKTKALDMLNAGVNAKAEELPTMEEGLKKCSSPEAKVAFLKSGKYRR